jgi:hypothetical protein
MNTRSLLTILLLLVALGGCRKTEKILPSRSGTWDVLKQTTEKLNAAGAVDSIITMSNVAVITFSPEGLGSVRNNQDNFVSPLVWSAYESGTSAEIVEMNYNDSTGDSLHYVFEVIESKGNSQKWEATRVNPKTGLSEIVNWELAPAE